RQSGLGADHHQARLHAARRDQARLRGAGQKGALFDLSAGARNLPIRSVTLSPPVLKPSTCSFSIRPRFLYARATAAMAASRSGGGSSSTSADLTAVTAAKAAMSCSNAWP